MDNRYDDINKFITDINKLRMDKYGTVYISEEEDYGISVCLEEQMERFLRCSLQFRRLFLQCIFS